ncbi:MAG: carboxymuconolactone decarboxylase family protein [Phycisphaerae bacterium]
MTTPAIDFARFRELAPDVVNALQSLSKAAAAAGLEPALIELLKIRASQINGCAFCILMHTTLARRAGLPDELLHLLPAWHEAADRFTDRQRAALTLCEALTRLSESPLAHNLIESARAHFTDKEIAYLLAAITSINSWNRIVLPLQFALSGAQQAADAAH